MTLTELYKQAIKDYRELKNFIKKYNVVALKDKKVITYNDFEKLSDLLHGHNFATAELFDLNFGVICTTILYDEKGLKLCGNCEIYDSEKGLIDNCFKLD